MRFLPSPNHRSCFFLRSIRWLLQSFHLVVKCFFCVSVKPETCIYILFDMRMSASQTILSLNIVFLQHFNHFNVAFFPFFFFIFGTLHLHDDSFSKLQLHIRTKANTFMFVLYLHINLRAGFRFFHFIQLWYLCWVVVSFSSSEKETAISGVHVHDAERKAKNKMKRCFTTISWHLNFV